ncbi:hypothetical protein [Sphingomonas lenta]|uniref:hypothetical protein n=1 Tax=Sphingomonas lenta TaxID=1141887 RepID=UPI001594F617|nr:hypothetical protein [Sphingomonas lenta]
MKQITLAARALFPVSGREAVRPPRRSGSSTLLQQLLAVTFAATPLVILIDAVAQTA